MKLRVQTVAGRIETIEIPAHVWVKEGHTLNRLTSDRGTEFWFDKQGYYDGWGQQLSGTVSEDDSASQEVVKLELDRLIRDAETPVDASPVPPSGLPPTACEGCGRLHRIMITPNESGTRTVAIWNQEQERYEEILLSRGASHTLIRELHGE